MAIIHFFSKPILLSIFVLAFCTPALAVTVQSPTCEIQGDADIYGIGIRSGFYLQWASLIIILIFCPREGGAHRTASTITTLTIYINTFRNMRQGSLVAVDYPLLWYLTSSLTFFNWPVTMAGLKRDGGSQAMVLIVWAMYYLAGPWVFFKGLQVGRQPGCDVKDVIFVPVSAYSKGLSTYLKVTSVFGVIYAILLLPIAATLAWIWLKSWEENVEPKEDEDENLFASRFLAYLQLLTGVFTIAFAEKLLKANRITFPNTNIANTGQLIPLLIGIFTFVASFINAMRATSRRNRRGASDPY